MKKKRYFAAFVVLFVLLLLFLVMNLCIGSVNIPFSEIPKILQGIGTDETYTEIVTQVRAPRAFAAVILGGALALSGYLLNLFPQSNRNPVYAGRFIWCKADCRIGDGSVPAIFSTARFMADDSCGLCRFHVMHGFCYSNVQSHQSDGNAHCQRRHDRLYLFCCD